MEWPADGARKYRPVNALRVGETLFHTWQEAEEREIALERLQIQDLLDRSYRQKFTFPGRAWLEADARRWTKRWSAYWRASS